MLTGFRIFLGLALCVLSPNIVYAQNTPAAASKVLVVYYSREGHTQLVAEQLAKRFNADLERLIDKKKRIGPIAFSAAGKDAVAGNLTKLEALKYNLQDYDLILIGTPSWFGNVTPAVRTYILQQDLSGKRIGLFGTTHLTGVENALSQAAALAAGEKAGEIPTLPLRHRDLDEEILASKIDAFYQQLNP